MPNVNVQQGAGLVTVNLDTFVTGEHHDLKDSELMLAAVVVLLREVVQDNPLEPVLDAVREAVLEPQEQPYDKPREAFNTVSQEMANAVPLTDEFLERAWDGDFGPINFGSPSAMKLEGTEWEIHFHTQPNCMTFSSSGGDALVTVLQSSEAVEDAYKRLARLKAIQDN